MIAHVKLDENMKLNEELERRHRLEKKLNHARKMTERKVAEVKRIATSIGFWQRRCSYYEREIGVTLAQKRAAAEARKQKRPRVRKVVL